VADRSELVAAQLAAARAWQRDELSLVFACELARRGPAASRDLLDALDVVTSWEAWNVLRARQGCSVARARRITEGLLLRTLRD